MIELTVSPIVERKIKQGICVLEARDFPLLGVDNTLVHLVNQQGKWLAQAYLSAQNKGIGWVISREQLPLNQAFFKQAFQVARTKRQAFEASDFTTAYRLFNQDGDGFGGMTIDTTNA